MAETGDASRTLRTSNLSSSWIVLRSLLSCKGKNDVRGKKKSKKNGFSGSFGRMRENSSIVRPEMATPEVGKKLSAVSTCNTSSRSLRSPCKDIGGGDISTSFASYSSASINASAISSSSSSLGGSFRGMHLRRFSGCYECHVTVDPINGPSGDPSMRAITCTSPGCGEIFLRPQSLELHRTIRHAGKCS